MTLWKRWRVRVALFAMVVGPGLITANVDNDAGGIATYSAAGAKYGYNILWVMPLVGILSGFVLWMCSKMAIATGKGLSALIRERFGIKVSAYLMLALILTNIANSISNFSGIGAGVEIFGLSRHLIVPVAAFLVWRLVIKGTYHSVERWFFVACFFYVTYIISAILARPDWGDAIRQTLAPQPSWDKYYLYAVVGIIGATIAPWMQFYQQASTVEKGIPAKHMRYAWWDVFLGAVAAAVVQYFIVLACGSTLHKEGILVESAEQAAQALRPIAGNYCAGLFALGLVTASTFGATILPISTTTSLCEAMGWERGVDKKFTEAPHYYVIYTLVIVVGALVALLAPEERLVPIMIFSQVANGVLLPAVLVCTVILASNRDIMGNYALGPIYKVIAWLGCGLVAAASLSMVVLTIAGI